MSAIAAIGKFIGRKPKKATACSRCGCYPPLGSGMRFKELEGSPLVCTACLFTALSGEVARWAITDLDSDVPGR